MMRSCPAPRARPSSCLTAHRQPCQLPHPLPSGPCCASARVHQRPRPARTFAQSTEGTSQVGVPLDEALAAVVNIPVPSKPAPSLPQCVPVMHSSAFLQSAVALQGSHEVDGRPSGSPARELQVADLAQRFDGSAFEWALSKVDRSLDELEQRPLPMQQQLFDMSNSPSAQATGRGLQAAADLTLKVGVQAVRAAAPVGKWALREGARAASGILKYVLLESTRSRDRGVAKDKVEDNKDKGKGGKQ